MLHVPINTILAAPAAHRSALSLPSPAPTDWPLLESLPPVNRNVFLTAFQAVERLSFWPLLQERMLGEAGLYVRHGFEALMLENVAGPYFVREDQPPVMYWVMRSLAERLSEAFPKLLKGIQVLAFADHWAMDIACVCGFQFIRCESALFEGVRPEGRTPNRGNLAKLYMARQQMLAPGQPEPQVYVDLQKKHTVFPRELESLEPWLDNIHFQKLEGVIITGAATGDAVAEDDLRRAREAIEKTKATTAATLGRPWDPPLLVGSGVTANNLAMCLRYADGVIVGSALKRGGYWENPLAEDRVRSFSDAWKRIVALDKA